MIVQIYEIQTPREAEMMVELGVDHVGSVLVAEDDWRNPELKNTVQLVQASGRKSSLIPLFSQVETISRVVEYYNPDILHLCENLPVNLNSGQEIESLLIIQRSVRERFPELSIMRSIPIGGDADGHSVPSLQYAAAFEPWSDWFLTDTLLINGNKASDDDQPVSGFVGITGKTCDWEIARQLVRQSGIPVILAGGIGPQNVAQGISRVMPAGVDSCTLTNAVDSDGRPKRFQKDPEKVKALVAGARKSLV